MQHFQINSSSISWEICTCPSKCASSVLRLMHSFHKVNHICEFLCNEAGKQSLHSLDFTNGIVIVCSSAVVHQEIFEEYFSHIKTYQSLYNMLLALEVTFSYPCSY